MKSLQALAQDWQALSPLLDEALALPTEERAAWLERLGPQAEGLRPRLRELLDLQDDVRTRGFLEALPVLPGLQAPALAVQVGDQVGPYRLVDEIGRGGMGTVWLAERADGLLKRRCALKLPLLAWSDSLRDRMAQERDILAGLDHPHIARLLDTGVDDQGRPFLALEHVQGEPIDTWMDARKLPVRERVALFVQVVDAIRYAHANLVIHRDLKPSNILVTAQGQAKLLDFGIAKLLSDASAGEPSDLTLTGQRLLTPRYASPEQILGQRLTAASDVYSLGVLLHELLCGQPPYAAGKTPDKLPEQAVLEADVRAPSRRASDPELASRRATTPERLARQLRGELDAIVLRAMARVPQERYASSEALQADLQAWLEGRPVQARNPGALAVAWKFVRRHRWPVVIGTAGVVATVVMAVVAGWMAWDLEREAKKAEAARGFLSDLLKEANPSRRQGRQLTLREMLEQAEASVESKYRTQPELREKVYKEVADLWAEFGEHGRRAAALAKRSAALESAGMTVALAESLLEEARVTSDLLKDLTRADQLLTRVETIAQQQTLPAEIQFHLALWWGWLDTFRWQPARALAAFERAERHASTVRKPYFVALAIRGQSLSLSRVGQWERADSALLRFQSLTKEPGAGWAPEELRIARWELAQELHRRGQYLSGWQLVQELMREDLETRGAFSISSMGDHMLWLRYCIALGYEQLAAEWLTQRRKALTVEDPGLRTPDWTLLEAQITSVLGDYSRALELLKRAEESFSKWPGGESKDDLRIRIEVVRARIAIHAGDMGLLQRAISALDPTGGLTLSQAGERQRKRAHSQFTALADRLRDSSESIRALAQAVELTESALGPRHPETLAMKANLVLNQQELGSFSQADAELASLARELALALPARHRVRTLLAQLMRRQQSAEIPNGRETTEKTPLNRGSGPVILPWSVG